MAEATGHLVPGGASESWSWSPWFWLGLEAGNRLHVPHGGVPGPLWLPWRFDHILYLQAPLGREAEMGAAWRSQGPKA